MKFNCGKFSANAKRRTKLDEVQKLRNWHWKFAYLPVRVADHDCRWWEWYQIRYPEAFIGPYTGNIRLSQHAYLVYDVRPKEEASYE